MSSLFLSEGVLKKGGSAPQAIVKNELQLSNPCLFLQVVVLHSMFMFETLKHPIGVATYMRVRWRSRESEACAIFHVRTDPKIPWWRCSMIDARLYRVFDTFGHHLHFDRVDQQKMSCNNKDGLIAWLRELHNEIDPHTREA